MRISMRDDSFQLVNSIKQKCMMVITDEAHRVIAQTFLASIEFISDIDVILRVLGSNEVYAEGDTSLDLLC